MSITRKRLTEVAKVLESFGDDEACAILDLTPQSLRRYKQWIAKEDIEIDSQKAVLLKIAEKYSESELKAIAKGASLTAGVHFNRPKLSFDGDTIKIAVFTDTHFGSKYTNPEFFLDSVKECERQKCDFMVHCGDVVEGLSHRQGHWYECSHIGFKEQKSHAIELLSQVNMPIYTISGNHDRWYMKSAGADIVKDICEAVPQMTFIGHDEGDIFLKTAKKPIIIKLWHGEDSSSYALSYRLQKLLEALTGGEKPHVLFAGHTHKALMIFERHVHCYSAGAIQKQSKWMRSKRMPSHTGFWIVKLKYNETGVTSSTGTFYPFYI